MLTTALLVLFAHFLLLVHPSYSQSFSTSFTPTATSKIPTAATESVDFTTITAWPALPGCLKQQLQLYEGGVAAWIGCNDNHCLCHELFAEAENDLASDALQECSYVSDMNSATSILSEYCQQKGYTSLIGATSINTAGIRKSPKPLDRPETHKPSRSNFCLRPRAGLTANVNIVRIR